MLAGFAALTGILITFLVICSVTDVPNEAIRFAVTVKLVDPLV
jgi:hypothetical protein